MQKSVLVGIATIKSSETSTTQKLSYAFWPSMYDAQLAKGK